MNNLPNLDKKPEWQQPRYGLAESDGVRHAYYAGHEEPMGAYAISDVIAWLESARALGATSISFGFEGEHAHLSMDLWKWRPENDSERDKRLAQEGVHNAQRVARERAEYERLKQKYGDK